MMISQNTLMGRVNIAFSMIKKGLFFSHPIKKLEKLFSKTRFTVGALNYPYLALLSMFSNNNLLPFKDLVSLIMINSLKGKISYNKLVKKLNLNQARLVVAPFLRLDAHTNKFKS
jgi:hypothetical protein